MPDPNTSLALLFPGLGQGGKGNKGPTEKSLSPLGRHAAEVVSSALKSNVLIPREASMPRGFNRDRQAMGQLFVSALDAWGNFQDTGKFVDVFAAYSAGIYPAMAAGGVCVEVAAELMAATLHGAEQNCAQGDLLGIVGLSLEEILPVLPTGVYLSHHNGYRHALVGGSDTNLKGLKSILKKMGAFSVRTMDLALPYHTPELAFASVVARKYFAAQIKRGQLSVSELRFDIMTGTGLLGMMPAGSDPSESALLQMSEPISWPIAMGLLAKMGVNHLEMMGSGRSLLRWSTRML